MDYEILVSEEGKSYKIVRLFFMFESRLKESCEIITEDGKRRLF